MKALRMDDEGAEGFNGADAEFLRAALAPTNDSFQDYSPSRSRHRQNHPQQQQPCVDSFLDYNSFTPYPLDDGNRNNSSRAKITTIQPYRFGQDSVDDEYDNDNG